MHFYFQQTFKKFIFSRILQNLVRKELGNNCFKHEINVGIESIDSKVMSSEMRTQFEPFALEWV